MTDMPDFAPYPWRITTPRQNAPYGTCASVYYDGGDCYVHLADVVGTMECRGPGKDWRRDLSTASVIRAAPELYAALRKLVQIVRADDITSDYADPECQAAEAALAKADDWSWGKDFAPDWCFIHKDEP